MNIVHCQKIYRDSRGMQHIDHIPEENPVTAEFLAYLEKLPVNNLSEIRDAENVSRVFIEGDRIVQACGYSWERGAFADLY